MSCLSTSLRRLLLVAPLAGAGLARAAAGDPALLPGPVTGTSVWSMPGLELQYTLQPGADGKAGPSVLRSVVDVGGPRLRTDVRIDPTAETRHVSAMDLSLELPTAGPIPNLVVGDSYASGAGWSQPARITGVRFGGAVTARAPLRTDGAIPVATPAFAAATRGLGESGESALVDARRLLPGAATAAAASAPTPSDPTPLQGGKTDYDVELGRLRDGWDTPDRMYVAEYGAAGYRAGLGGGLTAEARSEWTAAQNARGLELLQDLGAGVSLHAVMARSTGIDLSGRRWGMSVVRKGQGVAWRLDYAAADRDYRLITGATEAREGVRVGTSIALSRRATAEVSYVRRAAWDATPDTSMVLGTRIELPRQAKVSFDVAVGTTNGEPARRAGVSFSLPFEALRGTGP
jgi:outer membrane usher protein FimD/PapC